MSHNYFTAFSIDEARYLFQEDLTLWPADVCYEWTDSTTEIPCMISRGILLNWCGYAILKKDKIDQEHLTRDDILKLQKSIDDKIHGGITLQTLNEDGDVVFGFDCAHLGDYTPDHPTNPHVWVKNGVERETTFLAYCIERWIRERDLGSV